MIHAELRRCGTHRLLSLRVFSQQTAAEVADEAALSTFVARTAMVVSVGQVVVLIIGHFCFGGGLCASFSAGPAV